MILDYRLSLKRPSPQASGSQTQQEIVDKPPPYTRSSHGQGMPVPQTQLPPPPTSSSRFSETPTVTNPEPPATVNQVHLLSKKEDIIGTFYIDPQTPSLTHNKRKKHGKRAELPHASFQTRSGAIHLALSPTGNIKLSPKANVSVASRSGYIEVNLLPTTPNRPRIGLDVISRQGDIMVFLPVTFSGLIQLNTRKGELHVLPALAKLVKVLKATDKEAIVIMGAQVSQPEGENSLTDLCQLNSRSGKVIVGLSGQDTHPEKTGFWQKLGQFLRGS